jgi:hypothetical protein
VKLVRTAFGAPAYAALVAEVRELKSRDPLELVTVVVPTQLVAVTARRHLADNGPHGVGVAAVEFLTLRRIAERAAAPTLVAAGRRPAVAMVLAAAARAELREAPGILEPVARHDATVRALVDAHRELREISREHLDDIATTGALTADVVRIHRALVARLSDWYDERDLLDEASRNSGTTTAERVVLFLPSRPTAVELALLKAIDDHATLVAICATTGNERLDSWIDGLPGAVDGAGSAESGGAAGDGAPPVATDVLHASDADDEVRCVVRKVVEALDATAPHRLAVLFSRESPYARLVAEHLEAAGITWHGPGVAPLAERSVARGMLGLLGMAIDGMRRDALFAWMAGTKVVDGSGKLVPTQRWERISRSGGVVEEADWEPRLTTYVASLREQAAEAQLAVDNGDDTNAWLVDRKLGDAATADALVAFVQALQIRLNTLRTASTWTEMGEWLDTSLREVLGLAGEVTNLPDAELTALRRIRSHAAGLTLLDGVEAAATHVDLRDGLEQRLTDEAPQHGRPGDGVFVGPISAAPGVLADRVFLVGLADDLYPGRISEDALLPDEARAASAGELAGFRERIDDRHRGLIAALASAPHITASFPRGDLRRSSERLPSRWLLPTLRALSGKPKLEATKWESALNAVKDGGAVLSSGSYAESVRSTSWPVSEQEWRQRAAAAGDDLLGDPDTAAGRALLEARASASMTRFDGLIGDVAPDPTAAGRAISPTTLEAWVKCPFSYFMSRLLRVEPIESPEDIFRISAPVRGNIVHKSLELLLRDGRVPAPDEPWDERHHARLEEIALEVCAEHEARGLTGNPVLWVEDRAGIVADLHRALVDDDGYRRSRRSTWHEAELPIGRKGNPPVTITLPDGSELMLTGFADRVDRTETGSLVVVDIKSGKSSGFKGLGADDPTKSGSKLQLPVYGLAARAKYGSPDTKVEAEFWFVGRDLGDRIGYEITDEVVNEYATVLGKIVDGMRSGIFPLVPIAPTSWAAWVDCDYCDPDGLGTTERHSQWLEKAADPVLAAYHALTAVDA